MPGIAPGLVSGAYPENVLSILIPHMKIIADCNIPFVEEAFSSMGDVITLPGREMTAQHVRDADVLLVRSVTRVDESLLAHSPVQFVGTATIGFDHIDTDYLAARNIGFSRAPGCNAVSAAEYVVSALLLSADRQAYALSDKSVAIVGVGNVGGALYQRLQALGVECVLYDPPRQQRLADRDYADWDAVTGADIVSAHVPLVRDGEYPTFHMFDQAFFDALKPGALFVNTSRGKAVDEPGLGRTLATRDDLHLILDVWDGEPNIDVRLLERVETGTPHIAGYSFDGKVRGTAMIYNALCQHLGTEPVWAADRILAPPAEATICCDTSRSDQQCLLQAVTGAYDVRADDRALRCLESLDPSERGAWFDRLRKEYPRRREFANYTVVASHLRPRLLQQLEGLGFKTRPVD